MLYVIMEMELVMDGHGMLVELYVNCNEEPRCSVISRLGYLNTFIVIWELMTGFELDLYLLI